MENMIRKVMVECDRLRATSVIRYVYVYVALNSVVAKLMVLTSNYLNQNHRSSIREVFLIIFMDSTYREFQKVSADAKDLLFTRPPARRLQISHIEDVGNEVSYSEAEWSHPALTLKQNITVL